MVIRFEELSKRAVAARHWQWVEGMTAFTTVDALIGSDIDPDSRFRVMRVATVLDGHVQEITADGSNTRIPNTRKSIAGSDILFCDCSGHEDGTPEVAFTTTCYPDLTDPCTLGALAAVVREAWGKLNAYCSYNEGRLEWKVEINGRAYLGETEAEAWVKTLEAAP